MTLIGGVDAVDTYLTACNSHDGSMAFRLMVTPVRVVCANTLAAAIRRAKASFSIHHTTGARSQIQAAREALGLTFRFNAEFQTEAERMLDTAMTDGAVAMIVRTTGRTAEQARSALENVQPSGRLITVDEVAEAVWFCVANGGVNGQGINVDGGAIQS